MANILITGAGSAQEPAKAGHRIIATDLDATASNAVAAHIRNHSGQVRCNGRWTAR